MTHSPAPDSPSLAGLAAANGPWLAERLLRLMTQADQPLDRQVAQDAVEGASRVLSALLAQEGRLALQSPSGPEGTVDPAFALGREQAEQHRKAGLLLPASLKVQRLLRRAYDDLVRESWVEKDSRARAHEDVERFFERALAGLVAAWTGHAAPPLDPGLTERLALREDQLRRAMDAARQLTSALRESRQRAETLAAGLELARGQAAEAQARSEVRTGSLERETDQARAEAEALRARVAELETALLERGRHRQGHAEELRALREQLELAQAEAATAQAEAGTAQALAARQAEALRAADRLSGELRVRAEALDRRHAAQEAELARLRTERAALADETEAMRGRLAETGSRLAAVRAAEGQQALARLEQVGAELERERVRLADVEAQGAESRARLEAELEAERTRARALEGAAKDREAEREALLRERDALTHRCAQGEARCSMLEGRLAEAESRGAALAGELDHSRSQARSQAAGQGERVESLAAALAVAQTERDHAQAGQEAAAALLGEAEARAASLEQDVERLLAEIEAATRGELGQSLAAFIRLPQELLDDPATPPAQAGKLAAIRDSGYRLVNTVNLALDLFRMEQGRYRPPVGRSLDWAATLRRAAREAAQQAPAIWAQVELLLDGAPLTPEASLPAPGDPLLACALVERLLAEALAAAPGAAIRAALWQDGDGPGLEVSWPGEPALEQAHGHFAAPLPGDPDSARRWARRSALLLAQALGGALLLRAEAGRVALVLRAASAPGPGAAGAEARPGGK